MAKGFGNFMKDLIGPDDWKKAGSGLKNLLTSNGKVNSVNPTDMIKKAQESAGGMFSGIPRSVTNMSNGGGFGEAVKNAHSKDGKLNPLAIAGSFMGVSAAHRVATGGGLTKDSKGRGNLIGVPFI